MKTVNKQQSAIWTVFSCLVLALLFWGSLSGYSLAQEEFFEVRLGLVNPSNPAAPPQTRYLLNPPDEDADPIMAVVTIENVSGRDLLASRGYADNLHLLLRFVDPDGLQITAQRLLPESYGKNLPIFPDLDQSENVPGEPVELVPAVDLYGSPYTYSTNPFNLRLFYNFVKAGRHTGRAFRSAGIYETYHLIEGTNYAQFWERIFGGDFISNEIAFTLITDADGDLSCVPEQHLTLCPYQPLPDCEDRPAGADGILGTDDDGANIGPHRAEIANNGLDDDCNSATLDTQLVEFGTIEVEAATYTVSSDPTKQPLTELRLRLFDMSAESCVLTRFDDSWQNYHDVWEKCPNVAQGNTHTDAAGTATVNVAPGEYFMIAKHTPANGSPIYIGVSAGDVEKDQKIIRYLPLITTDGEIMPGICHVLKEKDSRILIIQPQYMVWTGGPAKCPFVFESKEGNWTVATELDPPKGFEADPASIDEVNVNAGSKTAVQSMITQNKPPSTSEPTKVKFTVKHQDWKNAKKVESKIDMISN